MALLSMAVTIELILGDPDPHRVSSINQLTAGVPYFHAVRVTSCQALGSHCDALYFTLPAAERWGARPLPLHRAEVLRRSDYKVGDALPSYVVAGTVVSQEELHDPKRQLQIILAAVVNAVQSFNSGQGTIVIRTVGLWKGWVGTDEMSPAEVAEA
jgi:hypothetical protein